MKQRRTKRGVRVQPARLAQTTLHDTIRRVRRTLIDVPDPDVIERRMAYLVMCVLQWAAGDVRLNVVDECRLYAALVRRELTEKQHERRNAV